MRGLGRVVERPDLHGVDALLEQRERKLVGAIEEGVEVLVLALLRVEAEVGRALRRLGLDVGVAGAGVVDLDPVAHAAAEQVAERQVRRLAEDVPQRDVDGRAAAHLGARRGKADVAREGALDALDVARVAAQERWRDDAVDMRLGRLRAIERLAEPGQALVRVHLHPEQVGELANPDRLYARDLHGSFPSPSAGTMTTILQRGEAIGRLPQRAWRCVSKPSARS